MKKKHLIITSYIIFVLFIIISNFSIVNADLHSSIWGEATKLSNAGQTIVGMIQWAGIMILIGVIIAKGIKFMSASPDGQASIKKELILLVIGAGMLFLVTEIIKFIIDVVQRAGLQ